MEEKKTMTVTEVLENTIQIMQAILIPAKLMDLIGTPINGCIGNIQQCVNALREAEQKHNDGITIEPAPETEERNG